MTLSALSGSPVGGMVLGLAYVFGMAFPLFVMALVWDRFHLGERKFLKARPVRIHLGSHILATNTVNLVVAAAFTVMGIFVMYLAGSGQMTSGRGSRWPSANAWPRPSAGWRRSPPRSRKLPSAWSSWRWQPYSSTPRFATAPAGGPPPHQTTRCPESRPATRTPPTSPSTHK